MSAGARVPFSQSRPTRMGINDKDALALTGRAKILKRFRGLGARSGNCPMPLRHEVWTRLGADMKPRQLGAIASREVPLETVIETASLLTERRALGRVRVACAPVTAVPPPQ